MNSEYKKLFGINFKTEDINTKGLPIYLSSRRSFFKLSYEDNSFLIVKIHSDERFGAVAFQKQAILLSERYDMPVAFEFDSITRTQRDSLIERKVPFISGSGQLYLPFLGMALSNSFPKHKQIRTQKMMPVTQALFLYILYISRDGFVAKKDAAEYLGVTRTSITRASEQLLAMELITQKNHGKESLMTANGSGIELFEKAKSYMINPIQSIITTTMYDDYDNNLLSGESALAECTMLNYPSIPVRAVYKSDIDLDLLQEIDVRWEPDSDAVKLELWKYDPKLFSDSGIVDPISLAMCYEDNFDERIEASIEDYLEGYKW